MQCRFALCGVLLIAMPCAIVGQSDTSDRTFSTLSSGRIGGGPAVGPRGNFNQALPLILPSPRGGVPMPFAVAYNGSNVVGVGGLGWDIPIAGVTWQHNLSRRKPIHEFQDGPAPTPAERLIVELGNGPMIMAKTNEMGVYQPFGNGYFELRITADGLTGKDGSGRQWNFAKIPALMDDDFYALMSIIDGTGNNRVDFYYDVYDKFSSTPLQPPFSTNQFSMRELVLREISHSPVQNGLTSAMSIRL